jgi:multiple sugar transport system ATP-binding protein
MAFLEIRNLTRRFKGKAVLEDLSLSVERGETVAVFGPSGSGKTVLLRLIAGVDRPDGGEIRLDGVDLTEQPPDRRDIGMAFQNFALYPHMSAYANIASPLRAKGASEDEIRAQVREVAALLRIDHVLTHAPRELSNGQKQRTALARALVQRPGVLLLDDPLRNVDAKLRYEMRIELPRVLARFQTTVLYVTQDYREAMALGQRVGVLEGGSFRQIGPPETVYAEPATVDVARLFGDPTINLFRRRIESDGNGAWTEFLGARIPVGAAADAGAACLVGIRPEHVQVAPAPIPDAVAVVLDAVTPLNVRTLLLLKDRDGEEIVATCPEEDAARFPRGHRDVWARIDPSRALVFDDRTGLRLPSGRI